MAAQLPLFPATEPAEPSPTKAAEVSLSPDSSRLVEGLARVGAEHPLEEKVLISPSLAIGHQIVERLARSGRPWMNLRVETVRTLAHAVVGLELSKEGIRLLSRAQALALVEQACSEELSEGSYFGALRDRPGLHRALQSALEELRAAGIGPGTLPRRAFADRQKHGEIVGILGRYAAALAAGRYVDSLEVLRRALAALERGDDPVTDALILLPEGAEHSSLERRFLEKLAGGRLRIVPTDEPADWIRAAGGARLFRATGEENEIREVFRRILAEGIPFDAVEILHTDASTYPSLLYELSHEHGVPCTFAGGVAVTYTRPGQAALAFLAWIAEGFAADRLREALSGHALTLRNAPAFSGSGSAAPGARAVARALREARIGWGRARHLRCLDRLITRLEQPAEPSRREEDLSEEERSRRAETRARRLEAARRAREFTARVLDLAPESMEAPADLRAIARGARIFVTEFGRISGDLDGTAKKALETLLQELEELIPLRLTVSAAVERLRDAVAGLSVAADRPRPGRVHVAFYRAGAFSGRRHTFLVGLDETRHPGRDLEDPVLLDEERGRINAALAEPRLALGRERPREAAAALGACLARLRGTLTASYSSFDLRNLSQAGEPAPSPHFLALYREACGRPTADYGDLAAALARPAGFLPEEDRALDDTEWWLSRLRPAGSAPAGASALPAVGAIYPWLADGDRAEAARESDAFTEYDGWVRCGTPELDPRSSGVPISVSRIQDLARCPFNFFARHVLHVEPPEDLKRDPTRWLDPLDEGSLLHEVFRRFFEEITEAGEKPDLARHLPRIEAIAHERIAQWRERIPERSEVAFSLQRDNILAACRTLLREEEGHCRDITPRYFEIPFGQPREARASRAPLASPDPVAITAGGGRTFFLRGSIDRVDEAPDGTFHIWDYKTGGTASVREGAGLRGGRQAQFALYAMAFEALLARAGAPGRVSKSGYFFPGRKGEGQRMAMPVDTAATWDVLGRLFDLVSAGLFPHALSKGDCRFCDLEAICGGVERASARARAKLENTPLRPLAAFKEIHEEEG